MALKTMPMPALKNKLPRLPAENSASALGAKYSRFSCKNATLTKNKNHTKQCENIARII